jgi:deoxyribose-phosphate aldolase
MNEIISKIEHTILKPDLMIQEVQDHCHKAVNWRCAGVCVPPYFAREAKRILSKVESPPKLAVVVGFPMGYAAISAKSEEIKRATDEGADEIDAVVNIAAIKNGTWNHVQSEIDLLVRASHMKGLQLKLIIEAGMLTDEEIKHVCELAGQSGVNFIKNSTGFFGLGATEEIIKKIRAACVPKIQIKASGGIKTLKDAAVLISAGADRIGTSATAHLVEEFKIV